MVCLIKLFCARLLTPVGLPLFLSRLFQEFLGHYHFKSKTLQDEFSPEGSCKAAMFALFVKEELESWPEQNTRRRSWLTIPEAYENCRHPWMREALKDGFSKWHENKISTGEAFPDQD
ncbi:Nudix hydrolase 16, mitochondrial [Vitis vinifera]|uniref:Nudix hydrolase 16, mitochondrial n=1 Tax=Vitis vinifera TaxID=29760 RepID=A0A438I8F4_VITVI|nr:Nudix hydrolase 16, mitochondrial [Vitis vinifera]